MDTVVVFGRSVKSSVGVALNIYSDGSYLCEGRAVRGLLDFESAFVIRVVHPG